MCIEFAAQLYGFLVLLLLVQGLMLLIYIANVFCHLVFLCPLILHSSSICTCYLETNCHDIVYTGDCNIPGNATLLYDINFVGVYSGNRSLPKRWKSSVDHLVSLLSLSWKWCHCTLLDWCWDRNPGTSWTSRSSFFCIHLTQLWDQEPHRLVMAHVWKFTFWRSA